MSRVEKKKGATQTCKCKTELICVEIESEWNGVKSTKLQWQNVIDHKPHYKFAGPGKFDCNIPAMGGISPQENEPIPINDSYFDSEEIKKIEEYIDEIKEIEKIVTRKLKTRTIDPNPAKVGMYVKFIFDKRNKSVK